MKDTDKTKEQLISELAAMRQRIAELETLETGRRQTEQALAYERNLLRTLIDNLPDYIYIKDIESRFVICNIATAHSMGMTKPEDLAGKTDFDFHPPEMAAQYYADEREIIRTGQPLINHEEPALDPTGNVRWYSAIKVPLRDNQGKIIGLVGISRDITERKQAEEKVKKYQDHLEELVAERTAKLRTANEQLQQEIIERKRTEKALARRAREMAVLYKTSLEINAQPDLSTLLQAIVRRATELLGTSMGGLFLVKPDGETLELVVDHNQPNDHLGTTLCMGEGLSGRITQTGKPMKIADYRHWEGQVPILADPIGRILGVPLKQGDRVIGVLDVFDQKTGTFDEEETKLLELFATQAVIAVENARLLDETRIQARQVQQILDTVQEGILLLDTEHRVKLANPAAQTYLTALAGVKVGEVLTRLGEQALAELLASSDQGPWQKVVFTGLPRRVFEVAIRSIVAELEAKGWVIVLRDVTEARQVQERIQQQERLAAVGQLAAGIAHDFNNILTSIIGYAELVRIAPNIPDSARLDLKRIVQQSQRAAHLIRQILDFSRQSIIEKRPMDMVSFLTETLKLLERTIPEDIRIGLEIEPGEYMLKADPTQIQQALANLAVNARDAMLTGGALQFRLSSLDLTAGERPPCPEMLPGNWLALSVSDTGTGIPPDVLPHIYEPFFTQKAVGEGVGLGLAQVYGIVKQHEGHINVESQVGQGTTFTLYFPVLPLSHNASAQTASVEVPRGHGEMILLVEDDTVMLEVTQSMLEHLGYQVLIATNGREALAVCDQYRDEIALVLTDVTMPELDGVALSQALRERNLAIKVVVLTGYPLEAEAKDLLAQGIVDWLQKPLSLDQLAQTVSRSLKLEPVS